MRAQRGEFQLRNTCAHPEPDALNVQGDGSFRTFLLERFDILVYVLRFAIYCPKLKKSVYIYGGFSVSAHISAHTRT